MNDRPPRINPDYESSLSIPQLRGENLGIRGLPTTKRTPETTKWRNEDSDQDN